MSNHTINTGTAQSIDVTHNGRAYSSVIVQNLGSGIVYVDTVPGVTTSTGMKIAAGASVGPFPLSRQTLYAVASADGQDVRVLLVG